MSRIYFWSARILRHINRCSWMAIAQLLLPISQYDVRTIDDAGFENCPFKWPPSLKIYTKTIVVVSCKEEREKRKWLFGPWRVFARPQEKMCLQQLRHVFFFCGKESFQSWAPVTSTRNQHSKKTVDSVASIHLKYLLSCDGGSFHYHVRFHWPRRKQR